MVGEYWAPYRITCAAYLAITGVLGTDVEWFNRVDDSPNAGDPYRAPKDYRKQALASVTTQRLPPTAGT